MKKSYLLMPLMAFFMLSSCGVQENINPQEPNTPVEPGKPDPEKPTPEPEKPTPTPDPEPVVPEEVVTVSLLTYDEFIEGIGKVREDNMAVYETTKTPYLMDYTYKNWNKVQSQMPGENIYNTIFNNTETKAVFSVSNKLIHGKIDTTTLRDESNNENSYDGKVYSRMKTTSTLSEVHREGIDELKRPMSINDASYTNKVEIEPFVEGQNKTESDASYVIFKGVENEENLDIAAHLFSTKQTLSIRSTSAVNYANPDIQELFNEVPTFKKIVNETIGTTTYEVTYIIDEKNQSEELGYKTFYRKNYMSFTYLNNLLLEFGFESETNQVAINGAIKTSGGKLNYKVKDYVNQGYNLEYDGFPIEQESYNKTKAITNLEFLFSFE